MDIIASLHYELSPLMIQRLITHAHSPCACMQRQRQGSHNMHRWSASMVKVAKGRHLLECNIATCGHADLYHCIPSVNLTVRPSDFAVQSVWVYIVILLNSNIYIVSPLKSHACTYNSQLSLIYRATSAAYIYYRTDNRLYQLLFLRMLLLWTCNSSILRNKSFNYLPSYYVCMQSLPRDCAAYSV